jgi:hypothetical protein
MGELTVQGLIFVIFAWGVVGSLTGYCIWKVIKIGSKLNDD